MMKTGLCSITFRQLSYLEIIEIAVKAQLDGIEWGSDYHVIPGDFDQAKQVSEATVKAGLKVASYGTYYRVGEENDFDFETILKTAQVLNTPIIRVWAGRKGSDQADEIQWQKVVNDAQRIADLATQYQCSIHFEYHGKTLTDTVTSAMQLMTKINRSNVYLYWQPAVDLSVSQRIEELKMVLPYISNVHVFNWKHIERLPLALGVQDWQNYLTVLANKPNRYYLLEFVLDDSIEQFYQDAQVLNQLIKKSA